MTARWRPAGCGNGARRPRPAEPRRASAPWKESISRSCRPGAEELRDTLDQLRRLYGQAYQWDAPAPAVTPDGAAYRNTMRYRIRAAINEWDLRRLYPNAQPETEGHEFGYRYDELPDMEKEVKDDETGG